ncbi:MAG: UDP-N-acetylmuramoyl-L-alanyl-D-glutamate-2,6-diaminopimelate ligase [Candidatus Nomurabacteria bacterium GW2011_GWB1_40_7]|uniref:UDP-N-acetylmuramoyl-L-alanyl-D-glutamate--2,6-diaminopimelate ligase n=1 Tax=Candidatus Nomurabacteria bacterium GW2011_GWB1_40_7 TaxID=1618744 RepID=A0A0G0T639_9BACT|nr:MAG: UDP-N-acetylmuramoyl-L-alanyl-D-glutamate-2,6-diaminopimelate ligase [Candidatus Nomurabacteria bacterium GW2011_GWB1_40_7]
MKNIVKNLRLKRRGVALLAGMHFYGNPSTKLKIIGVTGTNGKTTTATLLYKIATALGYKAGLISTVENIIAGEEVPIPELAPQTTPDPIYLHKLLNEMVEKGCEYVFMEVSSHALDQSRVTGINFTGGIFTNLTHDHLDYHKTIENYFGAKKKFFHMLPPEAFALSNSDDDYGDAMLEHIHARKFTYGFNKFEDFHGEITKLDFNGLLLSINKEEVYSKLLGKFNAYNLLAVWSACKLLGFDMVKVKKVLKNIEPPRGRFEHFTSKNGVLAIVDYAHSPDSLEKILLAVQELKQKNGRIISIFGCGGDRDPFKRPIMGRLGASLSDIAIFTSDNPRSEDSEKIIEQMKSNLAPEDLKKVKTIVNRHEAILEGVKMAKRGDIILCAGKGHENYQEIKGVKSHFDDMEELQKSFRQK